MWEDSAGFEGDDGNEDTDPCTPQLRAIDGINPNDRAFTEACKAGVTTVVTGMGSANAIGGILYAVKTAVNSKDEISSIDDRLIAPVAIKMALGENPKTVYHLKNQAPVTRMATAALIREQLLKTKRYMEDIKKVNEDTNPPEYDIKCEALIPLLSRKLQAHIHCHRADDIFTAIRIAKEFNLKYVLVHCTDGHLIKNALHKEKAKVFSGPALCERSKPELKNLNFKAVSELINTGILTSITTDHPETPIKYLPLCAAMAVREGLDEWEALKAITINPAKILGLNDKIGSLKKGKQADFTVFDKIPFDIYSHCCMTYINGEKVYSYAPD
jgi:imidazolonepropionase-like amidohydrolase